MQCQLPTGVARCSKNSSNRQATQASHQHIPWHLAKFLSRIYVHVCGNVTIYSTIHSPPKHFRNLMHNPQSTKTDTYLSQNLSHEIAKTADLRELACVVVMSCGVCFLSAVSYRMFSRTRRWILLSIQPKTIPSRRGTSAYCYKTLLQTLSHETGL